MNPSTVDPDHFLGNVISLRDRSGMTKIQNILRDRRTAPSATADILKEQYFLPLSGVISKTDDELWDDSHFRMPASLCTIDPAKHSVEVTQAEGSEDSDEEYGDQDVGQMTAVLKSGQSTGLTVGYVNNLPAVIRSTEDGQEVGRSWELTVVGYEKDNFSGEGDSGSAVVDLQGNMVDLVTCCCKGTTERPDITFVTPASFVLDTIKTYEQCVVDKKIASPVLILTWTRTKDRSESPGSSSRLAPSPRLPPDSLRHSCTAG